MISKNTIKLIHNLELRKFRKAEGKFVAEGNKLVHDNLDSMHCCMLVATSSWFEANPQARLKADECIEVSRLEMEKTSLLQTPQDVLAVFSIPNYSDIKPNAAQSLILALDSVQDPGNLGTIIRLADWFGISDIVCSTGTADCFNPKVVQATMGAIARVRVHYVNLPEYLAKARIDNIPVYGTFLEGSNIYTTPLSANGIIVMGNEGKGISAEVESKVSQKLNIPSFPADSVTSESLNVGVATAITVAEFRRRMQ